MAKRDAAIFSLSFGTKYPYNNRPPSDWAEGAALGVLADLGDRCGIKHGLEDVEDRATRDEIVTSLAAIIRRAKEATP